MSSSTLSYSRDALYSQWQRDVADARKARRADVEARGANELAVVDRQNEGALERLRKEGDSTLAVAKLKTQSDKELEAMRLAAGSEDLGRKLNADSQDAYQADVRKKFLFDWENRPGTPNERDAASREFIAGARGERQPMYKVDELAKFLSEATTDAEGNTHSISPSNRATLEEMASQAGYAPVYPEVGPHGKPYTYSHGIFGEWDSDIEKNNDIRFRRVAKPNEVMRKLR